MSKLKSLQIESTDLKENELLKIDKELLVILLEDKSTERNIIWATDNYIKHGVRYAPDKPICVDLITSKNGNLIKPRVEKSKIEQQNRVRNKAEVFTPSWICNVQNNLIDEQWFNRKSVFNKENDKSWNSVKSKIKFLEDDKKEWTDYVSAKRLEISCGEAPYITSRYDSVTGSFIEVPDRIGLLDRKLRIVNENTSDRDEWLKYAYTAVQNIYGFDWQGDNVLIARENVLFTIAEHYFYKFNNNLTIDDLINFAKVIVWNIWQMDGIKFVVPDSCCTKTIKEKTLFGEETISTGCEGCQKGNNLKHNGVYCRIKDWETHQTIRFVDLIG